MIAMPLQFVLGQLALCDIQRNADDPHNFTCFINIRDLGCTDPADPSLGLPGFVNVELRLATSYNLQIIFVIGLRLLFGVQSVERKAFQLFLRHFIGLAHIFVNPYKAVIFILVENQAGNAVNDDFQLR